MTQSDLLILYYGFDLFVLAAEFLISLAVKIVNNTPIEKPSISSQTSTIDDERSLNSCIVSSIIAVDNPKNNTQNINS